jgi:hypothetical protein
METLDVELDLVTKEAVSNALPSAMREATKDL